jgi:N-carbamoylputrescine amidase
MSSQSTRVAAVTMASVMGQPEENLSRIERWAGEAREAGADFAVFPEECITGSLNKSGLTLDEARAVVADASRITDYRLRDLSAALGMTLAVGTIEQVRDRFGNHVVIYGPTGHVATYSKIHLPNENEREWFVPGDRVLLVDSGNWRFGIGVCSDLNYPEVFRAAARAGAEFFLLAVGCSGDGTPEMAMRYAEQYSRLMYPCAVANALYIFYADQSGPDRMSLAFAQRLDGTVVDSCIAREGFVIAEVSRDAIRIARAGGDPANVDSVRPDVYTNVEVARGERPVREHR